MSKLIPEFFELLSQDDQRQYQELQSKVGAPENRYNRNKRLQTFNEILDEIRFFCQRNDSDDWRRYLVCGVCWVGLNREIAINTRQLRLLIIKSKSTINGALAKMGYATVPVKTHDPTEVIEMIPFLKTHPQELRQWTIRRLSSASTPKEEEIMKTNTETNKKKDKKINEEKEILAKEKRISISPPPSLYTNEKDMEIDFDRMFENEFTLPPDFLSQSFSVFDSPKTDLWNFSDSFLNPLQF